MYSRGEIIINIDRLGVISVTPSLFFVVIHVIRCYTESKDFKKRVTNDESTAISEND